ncbi:hypothetical protein GCM10010232_59490 [Streptomyces amakusaensis]|uniref:Lipoprotein n=1 Tax=Streptomyces amakusaensis TaxID=67271 RepID=A0ABW0APC4_9ACTN
MSPRPRPHRRSAALGRAARRALPAALALVLPLTATVSCGLNDEPERHTRACGVVVDGSGSAAATKDGFDAEAKLRAKLEKFLADNECRTTYFAPITRVSQASKCQISEIDLDPDLPGTADRDRTRTALRAAALTGARKLLKCAQKEEPGSDVIGGLARIALSRPSGEDRSFSLLVVSDFQQNDPEFRLGRQDLSTGARREAAVDALLKSHDIPDLAGTDIHPVGYGMKFDTKTSRYRQFDAFWTELLEGRMKARVHTTYR